MVFYEHLGRVLSSRLEELRKSSMKKCYINSFSRQTGVTQLNRSGKNVPNRESSTKQNKTKTTYTKLQVVNYGWNLEGEGSREGSKTKPSPDHKEPRNHD